MMHGPFALPNVKDIVSLREKIRENINKVKPDDYIMFTFPVTEVWRRYKELIEETGLLCESKNVTELVFYYPKRIDRWHYAFPAVGICPSVFTPDKRCIDVGAGRNPWPRANVVVDTNDETAQHLLPGQTFVAATLTQKMPFQNKEFDFATCFHVLEHVSDPMAAALELSRIAKEGLVEVPHPTKDGMLLYHETDHRWFILPSQKPDGPLYFSKINPDWWKALNDPEAIGAAYRNYIGNNFNIGDPAILRNYFTRIEPLTNTIYHWKDQLKVVILE